MLRATSTTLVLRLTSLKVPCVLLNNALMQRIMFIPVGKAHHHHLTTAEYRRSSNDAREVSSIDAAVLGGQVLGVHVVGGSVLWVSRI